ncbi:hypothetical protein ACLEPN_19375 [Myxococcus sp. 1LA]
MTQREQGDEDGKWSIKATAGVEVFINQGGNISIHQEDPYRGDSAVVELTADQVDRVIQFLQEAKQELKKRQSSQG